MYFFPKQKKKTNKQQTVLVSEYIGGGELFETIRKFPFKLVQLYVAEIAIALGMLNELNSKYFLMCDLIELNHLRNISRLPAQRRRNLP